MGARCAAWAVLAGWVALGGQPARAELALLSAPQHVQASLVAADASIRPGQPFTVALHFVHDPRWHTYWLNPGTGLATKLTWTLPAGFMAGDIQWPAPAPIKDRQGNVTGNGYEGDLLLPVTITPPANLPPGTPIELKARAAWLMCEQVCIPGNANVSLSLPVSSDAPAADPQWGAKIRAVLDNLPRTDPAWTLAATRAGKTVTLTVLPAAGANGGNPAAKISAGTLHFFSDDNLVGFELPQSARSNRGGFQLTLTMSDDGPQNPSRLIGVLTSDTGWNADGSLRGLRVDVPLTPGAATVDGTLGGTLLLAFLGGLILNLMPCVFPVLGIKILGFTHQAGRERAKVIAHGLVFAFGVLLSFWALAGLLAVLRAGGAQLGWGFQLQSPGFVFCLAAVMLIFGLNLSGVFEFGLGATGIGSGLQSRSGLVGSFFTGVLATVVATPCSAPFLAPALGAALALPTAASFAVFTAIAVGLSTPYLLLSIFPSAVKVLPRPGAWMETFKQFMAFPLYATVAYLAWVLAGQTGESASLMALFGLVVVALGAWFYGRWNVPGASAGRARFGLIAGAVLLAAGVWTGWPRPDHIAWQPWSAEAVAQLRAEGRPIYVDFTARWCATCQANKKLVFSSKEVLAAFADKKIATLKGDWTNSDPLITAELAKYNRSAVPFNLVWLPGKDEPVILPELLTPGAVLEALAPK
jgi:thiol:disulfide interchange protein DsbD